MPDENLLEEKIEMQKQEFKTEQLQETLQDTMQQTMFQPEIHMQPVQVRRDDRAKKVKRRGIADKVKNKYQGETHEVYGVTESEKQGTYARERKDAFQQHLSEMVAEHRGLRYDPEFSVIIEKIREYAEMTVDRKTSALRSRKLTEARELIRNYVEGKSGGTELFPEQEKALEIMKMYQLYFATFMDGNLSIPANAYEIKVTGDREPKLRKKHTGGLFSATYKDVSDRVLFPGEPSIEDIKQGEVGDCYLLAGLASVVMKDPMAIKRAMRDNGTTVTVRFFEPVKDIDGIEVGLRPVYVTVNKTIARYNLINRDVYSKGALWVQMIEKAYAAWGGTEREKDVDRKEELQKEIKERYLSNGMDMETAELRAEQEASDRMREMKASYEGIVGGSAGTFVRCLTGREEEMVQHLRLETKEQAEAVITKNVSQKVSSELILLLTSNSAFMGRKENQEAIERFTGEAGAETAQKLLEMNQNHMEDSMAMISGLGTVLAKFHKTLLARYYKVEENNKRASAAGVTAVRQTQPLYLEDIQELMREEINKALFTPKGKLRYKIGEEYRPVINAMVEHLLNRIEKEQDRETEESKDEDGLPKTQFVHRSESGKYTKYAEREYKEIEDALKNGYHINLGTMEFAGGKGGGLNGESESGGMVEGHAYTVMGTREMDGKKFIMLRNPWANGTLRYIRTVGPDGKEVIRREKDMDDVTDGIFYVELNEFIVKVSNLKINKEVRREKILEEGTPVFGLDKAENGGTELDFYDTYYEEARQSRVRFAQETKTQLETANPKLLQWKVPLEVYAAPGVETYLAPIEEYQELMTEENPLYLRNKTKIEAIIPRFMEELGKYALTSVQMEIIMTVQKRVSEEYAKLKGKKERTFKDIARMNRILRLQQSYNEQDGRLSELHDQRQESASVYLSAMVHLLKGLELDAEDEAKLKEQGLI